MPNPYKTLRLLLPDKPLLIGTVTAHLSDGRSALTMLGGGVLIARGQSVGVGQNAFVRNEIIEGVAPVLGYFEVDV